MLYTCSIFNRRQPWDGKDDTFNAFRCHGGDRRSDQHLCMVLDHRKDAIHVMSHHGARGLS